MLVFTTAVDPNSFNPDPIRIQGFDDQKPKKEIQQKFLKSFFDPKLQFTMSKLQEKPSALKREHPAHPGTPLIPDPVRIHSTGFHILDTILNLRYLRYVRMRN